MCKFNNHPTLWITHYITLIHKYRCSNLPLHNRCTQCHIMQYDVVCLRLLDMVGFALGQNNWWLNHHKLEVANRSDMSRLDSTQKLEAQATNWIVCQAGFSQAWFSYMLRLDSTRKMEANATDWIVCQASFSLRLMWRNLIRCDEAVGSRWVGLLFCPIGLAGSMFRHAWTPHSTGPWSLWSLQTPHTCTHDRS